MLLMPDPYILISDITSLLNTVYSNPPYLLLAQNLYISREKKPRIKNLNWNEIIV